MSNKIYFHSNEINKKFLQNVFYKFDLIELEQDHYENPETKNINVIIVTKDKKNNFFNNDFLLNNNVVFLSNNIKNIIEKNYPRTIFLHGPINIKKFLNSATSHFISKNIFFKDIEIKGETIINLKNNLSCSLTVLEKKILVELFENKKVKKDYFFEKILEIKKDTETKTAESHLTRIRKKLLIIKSKILITSKDNIYFLDN